MSLNNLKRHYEQSLDLIEENIERLRKLINFGRSTNLDVLDFELQIAQFEKKAQLVREHLDKLD